MPFPSIDELCVHPVSLEIPGLRIRMPGGGIITVPAGPNQAARLLASVSSALMPLQPLFDIFEALLSIVDVFDAVKSLNPVSIGSAVGKLIPKVSKLTAYIPQLSVPIMIKDILGVLISFSANLEVDLQANVVGQTKAAEARARGVALGLSAITAIVGASLIASASCEEENLNLQFQALAANLAPLNTLLAVVSGFGKIVGIAELPSLNISVSASVNGSTELLAATAGLRTALEAVYSALPG